MQLNHIPYKSSANAVVDLMSGRIDLQFGSIAPILPHIRSGRLRALATTGAARLAALPEVPTMIEAGLRGYDSLALVRHVRAARDARRQW